MALIDEYKQAIQDVLDGRAKEPPRPSELPWTEDKAATMWAAAAAELIAEAKMPEPSGGGVLVVNYDDNNATTTTYQDLKDALDSATPVFVRYKNNGRYRITPVCIYETYSGFYAYRLLGYESSYKNGTSVNLSYVSVAGNQSSDLSGVLAAPTTSTYALTATS